ncbi:MAG: hypothetical protein IT462_07610 [Planctomycetes bacterium]|nr:hypothetical protein [Planctomycetota bacterium]
MSGMRLSAMFTALLTLLVGCSSATTGGDSMASGLQTAFIKVSGMTRIEGIT